jgi:hypothetical protein
MQMMWHARDFFRSALPAHGVFGFTVIFSTSRPCERVWSLLIGWMESV